MRAERNPPLLPERSGFVDIGERHPLRDGTDLTIQIMAKTL